MTKVSEIVKALVEKPIRLTYSTKTLCKQFDCSKEDIQQAKQIIRNEASEDAMKELEYWHESQKSISLKDFARTIGIDMDTPVEDDYDNPEPANWVEKQKWVKTKDKSVLYVRDDQANYQKEFERFVSTYKTPKLPVFHVPSRGSKMAVVCMFDIHLGKVADLYYTGNVDNPLMQEDNYQTEFAKLYTWLEKQDIEEILLPIGNDFFNVDDTRLTTTQGTPQDNTKNLQGVFELGLNLMCWTIDCLRQKWKVKVALVPGNHSGYTETLLATALAKIYEGVEGLTIDSRPVTRKYFKYGNNLIGLAHGELPLKRYADLLPYEAREFFSSCKHHEILVGDKHKEEVYRDHIVDGFGPIIRRLGALTKTDIWHYNQGFTLSKRRSYVLLYDKEKGLEVQYTNHAN